MHAMRTLAFCTLLGSSLAAQTPVGPAAPETPIQAPQNEGFGGLMVLPTHILMEGRTRSAEVMLRNSGVAAASYRIMMAEMAMDQDGKVADRSKKEGELTVSDFLFFSPKQVDLAPGETQTVRLQIHKPEGMPDGEYRSHMVFEAIPPPAPAEHLEANSAPELSFNITMVLGVSIPVTVRQGTMVGKATLAGLHHVQPKTADSAPLLAFRLERQGNCSLRGDLTASLESGGKLKKGTVLYELKNVVVYPETPFREFKMPMWQSLDGGLDSARIKLSFQATELPLPVETTFLDWLP
jgi:hypothetical protein